MKKSYKSYKAFEKLVSENETSIPKVANNLDIPTTSLYDWKNGKSRPKLEKLLKIANFFNVDVSVFSE